METSEAWEALQVFLKGNIAAVRTAFARQSGAGAVGRRLPRLAVSHRRCWRGSPNWTCCATSKCCRACRAARSSARTITSKSASSFEEKADHDITREDYIEIVKRVERDFLEGVQRNIRMRVLGRDADEPQNDVRSALHAHAARRRTLRARDLFAASKTEARTRSAGSMTCSSIRKVRRRGFRPSTTTGGAAAKVPILVLNATTLNTGNNWQFTACWMGEPAVSTDDQIRRQLSLAPDVLLGRARRVQANPARPRGCRLVVRAGLVRTAGVGQALSRQGRASGGRRRA